MVDHLMSVPKSTEMMIRDLLQEKLKKRGVTVVPKFSVSTSTGMLKPVVLSKSHEENMFIVEEL